MRWRDLSRYFHVPNRATHRVYSMKRLVDVALVLIVFLPASLIGLCTVLVLLPLTGGKPIFAQRRPGKDGRLFTLYKFRTMTDARNDQGDLLPDHARLTPVGRWLRTTSLDELPQLYNVLRGDMSLVGPRPLLEEYLPLYTPQQARRHAVRPGLTGLAQVSGRNALTWDEKFALDIAYVESQSLRLDCWILARTIAQALTRKGVDWDDDTTMPLFTGTRETGTGETGTRETAPSKTAAPPTIAEEHNT